MLTSIKMRRRGGVVAAVAGASLLLAACSSTAEEPEPAGTTDDEAHSLTVTMIPKNLGNPYFDGAQQGGVEAVGEIGGTLDFVGPPEASPDSQVSYINTAVQQGVSALAISANDPNALCDAIGDARAAGVAVVTFDSDTNKDCRDVFINQATAEGIARVQVEMVADQIGGAGQIAILSASANATNQNAWIADMEALIASDYPDIELVDIVYGDDEDQLSFDQAAALLTKYPDLKGIVAPTTVGIRAAARYVSTSEFKGEVWVTGLGLPSEMREYVKDGTVKEFALWNPIDLGYLAVYAGEAVADGEITGAEGDTFDAGRLGSYTVGADGVVLYGDPFRFNAENIDDFGF